MTGPTPPRPRSFDLAERRKHWAYQPVRDPPPPGAARPLGAVAHRSRSSWPGCGRRGSQPAAPADRRTLIRRVTFDLIGLPPTPDEVEAFVADRAPDAFARVVDRLLASPHYGERWARHWLDLVRYTETLGFEFDFDLYNVWRYRDYVIRAFNDDLPYDQLLVEHLAGRPARAAAHGPAGVRPRSNESVLATAFYSMGEGRQTPLDIRQEQVDRIDNQIDVLAKTFLAQTIACARCHDHKFDAISTRDYYALAGYFKSSRVQQGFLAPPAQAAIRDRQSGRPAAAAAGGGGGAAGTAVAAAGRAAWALPAGQPGGAGLDGSAAHETVARETGPRRRSAASAGSPRSRTAPPARPSRCTPGRCWPAPRPPRRPASTSASGARAVAARRARAGGARGGESERFEDLAGPDLRGLVRQRRRLRRRPPRAPAICWPSPWPEGWSFRLAEARAPTAACCRPGCRASCARAASPSASATCTSGWPAAAPA